MRLRDRVSVSAHQSELGKSFGGDPNRQPLRSLWTNLEDCEVIRHTYDAASETITNNHKIHMAKIYSTPEEIPTPAVDYANYNPEKEDAAEAEWLEKLKAFCVQHGNGATAGEEVRAATPGGYARYMVISEKPLQLFHLELGDAWSGGAIWERGLRLSDVRAMVKCNKNPLFGSSK